MAELKSLLPAPAPEPYEVPDPLDEFTDLLGEVARRPKLTGLPQNPRDRR